MTRDETQALGYAIAILRDRLDVEASHNAAIIRGYINTLAALRSRPAPPDDPQLGGHQCINVALDAANFCALRGDPLHAVGIRILVERYQKLAAPVAAPDDLERKHRVPDDVMMLARAGKLIDAIKLLRHDFELPLKEAKLLVEDAMRIEAIRATAAAPAAPAPVAAPAPETTAPDAMPAPFSPPMGVCQWLDDGGDYATECGHGWQFIDGDVTLNDAKFCLFCGGKIQVIGAEAQP